MDVKTVKKLMQLSQLALEPAEVAAFTNDLGDILRFVEVMEGVNTAGVEPLAHPVELEQPFRSDVIEREVDREHLQKVAPDVQEGLYIVPRVVSKT